MKAVWNSAVIADSEDVVVLEGSNYFPPESVKTEYLEKSERTSVCPWKGEATYYHVIVDGVTVKDAAWSYSNPKPQVGDIRNRIAFLKGVELMP
jgi:uncharacterized protein (DUF427 family)